MKMKEEEKLKEEIKETEGDDESKIEDRDMEYR